MTDYRLRPKAEADLEDIWRYSASHWSDRQADSYIEAVLDALDLLAKEPLRGRPADFRQGYRKHPVRSHFIFYRQYGSQIDVVRILHQRMNVEPHLRDEP